MVERPLIVNELEEESILRGKRITILTLGCKVNQYETDGMRELLEDIGCNFVKNDQEADICLVNTCSVTNMAERKSRQMLHRVKRQNPQAVVVAAGCYVQAAPQEVLEDLSVDLVIGNDDKQNIVKILTKHLKNQSNNKEQKPQMQNGDNIITKSEADETDASEEGKACRSWMDLKLTHMTGHTRAYIKIQDGCNQFCSYCIIPYVRGRIRSREPEDILTEVHCLARTGCKEVVLTGIHLSSYGRDWQKEADGSALLELIGRISQIKGIVRIRLGSLEPRIITEDFVSALKQYKKVCPHFHLSLQSGCNETLKRMNRKYSIEEYRESCRILRQAYDRPALTTDIIVGFPGETREEFETTCRNLEALHLYEMHVFKYSRRKGTVADRMPDQVSEEEKNRRSDRLLAMTARQKREYEESFRGERVQVLIEERLDKRSETGQRNEKVEKDGKDWYSGHTERYIRVEVQSEQNLENCVTETIL